MPPAYEELSDLVESTAIASLLDAKSTLVLRLFIVGHGDVWQDRSDMIPLYSSTVGITAATIHTKKPKVLVIKRDFDEDFARCVVNNGCGRCRKSAQ